MSTQMWLETMPKASLIGEGDWMGDMRALPTLPSVLFRFLGLVGNPSVSQSELADYIWKDPALLARVLPLAEAGATRRGAADSLQSHIAALSHARIRNIAFTTPLLRSFEPLGTGSYAMTLWERSLLCATACEATAGYLGLENPDRYYVVGMLHDIGYLVLLQQRPSLVPTILQKWATAPARLLEIEQQMMGVDHCTLGLEAATRLGLPSWVMPAIAAHHSPTRDSGIMTRITAIGGAFANYQGADLFPRRSPHARPGSARRPARESQSLRPATGPAHRRETAAVWNSVRSYLNAACPRKAARARSNLSMAGIESGNRDENARRGPGVRIQRAA